MNESEITAVRRIRHEISEKFNHDVDKCIEYYRAVEDELRASGEFKFAEPLPPERFGGGLKKVST